MIAVVTTFSQRGYEVYGRWFIESFKAHWPADVPLHVFYEGEKPADASERCNWISLDGDPERAKFMEEHKGKEDPQDYRKCAVRFSHKVWAMTKAPRDTETLIYLDADCQTTAPVTHAHLRSVLPDPGQCGSFLARPYHRHSETGFLGFRLNNSGGDVLDELRRVYVSGQLFTLPEHHDCMAYDFVRRKFERAGHRFKNLCPQARGLDVFEQSPLARFIKHNKGPKAKQEAYGSTLDGQEEAA